jgi:drug/metabolite transporter (DMT)-like permease
MFPLLLVSLLWAFSFGLIKGKLVGLDATAVSVVRLALAALVFLPWLKPRALALRDALWLAAVGAIQFGVMYVLYINAFARMQAHEVALATILTPVYVTLLDAALLGKLRGRYLAAALLAVAGAAALVWKSRGSDTFITGFLLVQGSNLCFAAGQVAYKRTRATLPKIATDAGVFFWLYAGALVATLTASTVMTDWHAFRPTAAQWQVLVYLGVLASGLGFFMWNYGATRVNTGTLAVFNNAKIPLAVACSILFFGEQADGVRLTVSCILMLAAIALTECSALDTKKAG